MTRLQAETAARLVRAHQAYGRAPGLWTAVRMALWAVLARAVGIRRIGAGPS